VKQDIKLHLEIWEVHFLGIWHKVNTEITFSSTSTLETFKQVLSSTLKKQVHHIINKGPKIHIKEKFDVYVNTDDDFAMLRDGDCLYVILK